jgi:DNA-directed RNA polymerase specialized sigma24 family protein
MAERKYMRTGGADRHWLFDHSDVESIPTINNHLVHYDEYFVEEDGYESTLAIILDKMLDDLPEDLRGPVSLVHLSGVSYRSAGRTLNLDHKTVKSRAEKGIEVLRSRLKDTAWIASLLDGMIPDEQEPEKLSSPEKVAGILGSLAQRRPQ